MALVHIPNAFLFFLLLADFPVLLSSSTMDFFRNSSILPSVLEFALTVLFYWLRPYLSKTNGPKRAKIFFNSFLRMNFNEL